MTNKFELPKAFPGAPNIQENHHGKAIKIENLKGTKAGSNGTLISIILDESGSMSSCLNETIDGFNEFLNGQRRDQQGACFLNVVKFEGGKVENLHRHKPLNEVPDLNRTTYQPGGATNLLDAVGLTIQDIDEFLASKPESERPAVVVVIFTDGQENMSTRFDYETIKSMVQNRQNDNDWAFMFFGANIDAFSTGSMLGLSSASTVQYSTDNMIETMAVASAATTRYAEARASGMSTVEYAQTMGFFTAEERNKVQK